METAISIDFGALGSLERIVGFLVTLAAAVMATWVIEKKQRVAPAAEFRQARSIAVVATAVVTALIFVFMAGSERLVALGTTAAGGTVGCLVFFLGNVWSGVQKGKAAARVITYLGTFILYVVSGSVALSAAGLLVYVIGANPQNKDEHQRSAALQTYEVRVDLEGRRVVTTLGSRVPFRASSGQVNFGCEQPVTTRAVFEVPADANVQGEVTAQWVNVANARSYQATAEFDGPRVVGTGTITGLDLQRILGFSNCPGGGHGELMISGEYVPSTAIEEGYRHRLSGTVSSSPVEARKVALTLPSERDVQLASAKIALLRGEEEVDNLALSFEDRDQRASQRGAFEVVRTRCPANGAEVDCLRVTLTAHDQ